MGVVGLAVRVDGHQHPVVPAAALENQLFGLHQNVAVAAAAQRRAGRARARQRGDPVGQFVVLRRFDGGTQRVIPALFLALDAPLAAVIHRRNAGHTEQQAVGGFQAVFVGEDAGDAGHIMVVQKAHGMFAGVQAPRFTAELPVEAVRNFVHVAGVEAGI